MAKGGLDIKGTVITHCYGNLTKIIIPDGITEIADGAFACNDYVKQVIIPDSVKRIGNRAFGWCGNLSKINIPDSVTEIGERAFIDCGFLREIKLGENVEELGNYAFWLCSNLKKAELSRKLKRIRRGAFCDCIRLRYVEMGDGVTVIENEAFMNTKTGNMFLGGKLEEIGDYAFKNSDAHIIEIPASVKKVGKKIADGCEWFLRFECYPIAKPDGWDGEWNVVNGERPFTVWDFANTNGVVGKYDKSQLYIDGSVLKRCDKGAREVYVPDGVTTIDDGAFSGCEKLEKLSLPGSLNRICDDVFDLRLAIKVFEFRGTILQWCGIAFYDFSANPMRYAEKILFGDKELSDADIPEGVTEINNYVFGNCYLNKITLPHGLIRIGMDAFTFASVTEITFPESIEEIDDYAFAYCDNLRKVVFPRGLKVIGSCAFAYCDNLTEVTLSRKTQVKDDAFELSGGVDKLIINYLD
ncbi:MAG: leucine-rich repeat domain-containing protein [Clostridiales bacterium]|nr:leucine-rich repeat domain-containing protein [Clostridiales bacterium]